MSELWHLPFVLCVMWGWSSQAVISSSYVHFPHFPPTINTSPRMKELKVLYSWRKVEFAFPTFESRKELIFSGHYVPGAAVILDSDFWSKGGNEKVIVTLPRMKPGIPATIATVDPHRRAADRSHLLQPYPDWSWHGDRDCESIISVFRTKVDECGRLWIVDTGVVDSLNSAKRICPPKLLVFDMATDVLEFKYIFPDSVLMYDSLLVSIAVDIRGGRCSDAFAYIADVLKFGLIVFDARSLSSWRVNHNYFYPSPLHGSFSIAGENFDLMDGLIGLALSPIQNNGDKTLFFHSLASVREGKVSANLLRNSSNFPFGQNLMSKKFYLSSEGRPSQSAAEDMSRHRILFFGLLAPSAIACWNYKLPYTPANLVTVAQSNSTLQFASGLKIVSKSGNEELLVTSSRFHSYFLGSLNHSEDNYHILSASVVDLVRGLELQGLLDAFEHSSKPTGNNDDVKKTSPEESWSKSLFSSPKKKLQARWEQVSPSVKQTLQRYTPGKLKGFFGDPGSTDEDVRTMEDCASASHTGSQILAERKSRYKQIAAFYLNEASSGTYVTTSSHSESYLPYDENKTEGKTDLAIVAKNRVENQNKVPYKAVSNVKQSDENDIKSQNVSTCSLIIKSDDKNSEYDYKDTELNFNEDALKQEEDIKETDDNSNAYDITFNDLESQEEIKSSNFSDIVGEENLSDTHLTSEVESKILAMPMGPPDIVLQEPDMPGVILRPQSLHPPPLDPAGDLKRKSPVTVQEWVDHLPVKPTSISPTARSDEPIESAAMLRCQAAARLSREASVQSSSSLDSLLDSRRPDPVEVLLNLGFGGVPGIDLENCRIPKRFLVPSKCKGGDWDEFLRRELLQIQNFECASLGFRGLSGPSHQRPSAIVANIMEKLREQKTPRPPPRTRFTSVARRVLSETSVLSRLTSHHTPPSTTSVLTPDNRKFLESQGKISPEVPRRRIIFGQKSFAIDKDGELVEEETAPQKESVTSGVSEVSVGSWSAGGSVESDSEDCKSELVPSPAELLRMRRSSLQRQRNVEEGEDRDGPAVPHRFHPVSEDCDDLRGAIDAEIQNFSHKIQSAPPEELAAIFETIKGLRERLSEL